MGECTHVIKSAIQLINRSIRAKFIFVDCWGLIGPQMAMGGYNMIFKSFISRSVPPFTIFISE